MEKRNTIISLIIIGVIIIGAITIIILSGITTQGYNYVQIEINPRAEFICDNNNNVISSYPLNEDAQIVMSDIDFSNMQIEDAVIKFIDESARCGFIDVNGVANATNITILDGITQALDVHITQKIFEYYRTKEIMSSITENYEIRQIFNDKKEAQISCPNKYKLIKTMLEKDNTQNLQDLKKLSEAELVKMVLSKHQQQPFQPSVQNINTKKELVANNINKYTQHMNAISDFSQQEFSTLLDDFQKQSTDNYFQDFDKEYSNWQKDISN